MGNVKQIVPKAVLNREPPKKIKYAFENGIKLAELQGETIVGTVAMYNLFCDLAEKYAIKIHRGDVMQPKLDALLHPEYYMPVSNVDRFVNASKTKK